MPKICKNLLWKYSAEFQRLFWSKVDATPGHGPKGKCWVWTAGTTKGGYGQIQYRAISNQPLYAHRIAYELRHGEEIHNNLHVLHKCDYPLCMRHLFLGTQKQNSQDAARKGLMASGDRNGARTMRHHNPFVRDGGSGLARADHPMAKLTEKEVELIRSKQARGRTMTSLALEYKVSITHISRIVHKKSWK